MPIKKFKTFEEASKDLWVMETDEEYFNRLKEYFEFWSKLTISKSPKGIQKFKSLNDPRLKRFKY